MKRQTTISFLCLLLTAFLAITLTGCPVTPRGTGPEGEAVDEGEAVRVGGRVQEGEGETVQPTEGEGETVQPTEGETVMLPGNVPLEMVWIPAGTFMMGAHEGEQDGYDSEYPQHQVTLTSGFWMGKYEVTQAQWKAVMNDNPSYFQGANAEGETNTDNRPVENVSWNDITDSFLPALNTATGKTFRLPTEAQWEYAMRAGTQTRFYWGDDPEYTAIGDYAWYYENSDYQTHDVGGKLPNAFGLYDMSGNVWEWVQDWYYWTYPSGSVTDPTGPPTGLSRASRGGSWYYYHGDCRSASRYDADPSGTYSHMGFRLVR